MEVAKNSHALGAERKWDFHPKKVIAAFTASSGAVNLGGVIIDKESEKIAGSLLE